MMTFVYRLLILAVSWQLVKAFSLLPRNAQRKLDQRRRHGQTSVHSRSNVNIECPADIWRTSSVLAACFPETPRVAHAATLAAGPQAQANIFFDVTGPALTAAVSTIGGEYIACAQAVPAQLRRESLEAVGETRCEGKPDVLFVQSVAVLPLYRRQGFGKALMNWIDIQAESRGFDYIWLAVSIGEEAALELYLGQGFNVVSQETFGNLLMSKRLGSFRKNEEQQTASNNGPNVQQSPAPTRLGASLPALIREMTAQSRVGFVAALGISFLVAPLGGRGVVELITGPVDGQNMFLSFIGGGSLGLFAEKIRRTIQTSAPASQGEGLVAECRKDSALLRQKAATFRVGGSRGPTLGAVAAITCWQLGVSFAEELYYRGLLQSASQSALAALGPPQLSESGSLLLASTLFGLVHVPWKSSDDCINSEVKCEWFLETGAWGLFYGVIFVSFGHCLLGPVAAHAAQNILWCSEDLEEMSCVDQAELLELFE